MMHSKKLSIMATVLNLLPGGLWPAHIKQQENKETALTNIIRLNDWNV